MDCIKVCANSPVVMTGWQLLQLVWSMRRPSVIVTSTGHSELLQLCQKEGGHRIEHLGSLPGVVG